LILGKRVKMRRNTGESVFTKTQLLRLISTLARCGGGYTGEVESAGRGRQSLTKSGKETRANRHKSWRAQETRLPRSEDETSRTGRRKGDKERESSLLGDPTCVS